MSEKAQISIFVLLVVLIFVGLFLFGKVIYWGYAGQQECKRSHPELELDNWNRNNLEKGWTRCCYKSYDSNHEGIIDCLILDRGGS